MSGHVRIGRLCVRTQGKPELDVESRDIAVLGTGGLLEMRGNLYSPKTHKKRCLSGLGPGGIQDLGEEVLVREMLSSSKCNGASGVGTRCFKTFRLPEEEDDENKRECLLPINKALVLLGLENLRAFLASASEEERGGGRDR